MCIWLLHVLSCFSQLHLSCLGALRLRYKARLKLESLLKQSFKHESFQTRIRYQQRDTENKNEMFLTINVMLIVDSQ